MWSLCDNHATTCHSHHLVSRPPSWQTWDLRVPTLFSPNLFILLHANASLIAPQWSYTYLFSFPTWRPNVCTLVPCLHPCLLHPHADSCISYRYPPDSILIAYGFLQPCGTIFYKWFSNFIVFPQINYHKSYPSWTFLWVILSFYLAHSMRSLPLEHFPTTQVIAFSTDTSISDCLHLAPGLSHHSI